MCAAPSSTRLPPRVLSAFSGPNDDATNRRAWKQRRFEMTKPEFIRAVTPKFKPRYENFIGGEWVAPVAGRYFENTSPVNGRVLCEVAQSDAADVELALNAAHKAKDAWGRTSVTERAIMLNRIADRMEENLQAIAEAET